MCMCRGVHEIFISSKHKFLFVKSKLYRNLPFTGSALGLITNIPVAQGVGNDLSIYYLIMPLVHSHIVWHGPLSFLCFGLLFFPSLFCAIHHSWIVRLLFILGPKDEG